MSYFLTSISSIIFIIFLSKFINFTNQFRFFISVLICILFSLIFLIIGSELAFIIIKIAVLIFGFLRLYQKKISLNNHDYLFLIIAAFLFYYSYGDLFYKTDIIHGYGYLTKAIFQYFSLPHFEPRSNFSNFQIDIMGNLFYIFFLSGAELFREDVVILSHNIFLVSIFMSFFKKIEFNYETLKYIFLILIIFFCTINIFGMGGKIPFSEELTISINFFLIAFIFENRNKINNTKILFVLLFCFFLIGLGKKSAIFLSLTPLLFLFIFQKRLKNKLFLPIVSVFFIITPYVFVNSIASDLNNHYNDTNNRDLISQVSKYENYTDKKKIFKKRSIETNNVLFADNIFFQRIELRKNYYKEYPKEFSDIIINLSKEIFTIEVYKASLLPPLRYYLKNYTKFEYKGISANLIIWLTIFISLLIYINLKNKKNFNFKILQINFFIFLISLFICISLVFEDSLRTLEVIDRSENNINYSIESNLKKIRDISRYLGWPIFLFLLSFIFLIKKYTKTNKSNEFLLIISIILVILLPTRSYGYLIKINTGKDDVLKLNNEIINNFDKKFENLCRKGKYTVAIGADQNDLWDLFYYKYYNLDNNIIIVTTNFAYSKNQFTKSKNTKFILDNFLDNKIKQSNLLDCLIIHKKTLNKLGINYKLSDEYFETSSIVVIKI